MIEVRRVGPEIGAEIHGVDVSYHKAAGDDPPEEDRIHWRVSIKEGAGSRSQ